MSGFRAYSVALFLLLAASSLLHSAVQTFGIDIYRFQQKCDIHKMIRSTDGGFLLLGTYFFNEFNSDLIVMKLGPSGAVLWKRVIGETSTFGSFEGGIDFILRSDGTIVAAGGRRIYQLSSSGSILKKEEFAGGIIRRILSSPDGGYYVAGDTPEPGNLVKRNLFLTKVGAAGNIEWTRIYRHLTGTFFLTFLRPVVNGYLIGGMITGSSYTFLLKVSAAGDIIWQKKLLLPNLIPQAYASGNNIYLIDSTSGTIGRIRIIRLSQSGKVMWSREVSSGDLRVQSARVIATSGSVIIAGESSRSPSSAFLLRVSAGGTIQSLSSFPASTGVESIATTRNRFTFLAKRFNTEIRRSETVIMDTLPSGEIPGCFLPEAIPNTFRSFPVTSSSSQITTGIAEATLTPVTSKLTQARHTRIRVCQ